MRKLLIQDNFYKSVPFNKRKKVERLCEELERQLNYSDSGINGTSLASQSRKFHGRNGLFKFRASDGDRIMFTYTKYLKNCREKYDSEIYLIEYISQHDQQNRRARNFNENTKRKTEDKKYDKKMFTLIEEAEDEEYNHYKRYFDLNTTIVYVKSDKELSRLFEKEIYISNEQFEYVCNMGATVLLGGAGSGKTLVCLHKLNGYKEQSGKKAYFTYSQGLKNKSEKIFYTISSINDEIYFYTLDSYCLSLLGLKESQYIDFFWFKDNFNTIKKSIQLPSNIDVIDAWSEIRGIIKGYMWNKWVRVFPIPFTEITQISRKVLECRYKYIKAYSDDGREIICEDISEIRKKEIIESLHEDDEILDKEKEIIIKDLEKIYKMSVAFEYKKTEGNYDKRILPLDEYLRLSNDVSIYSEYERRAIHALCVNYQQYIDNNNLYDDNDLAGLSIEKLSKSSQKPFEFLVVDEVQDLTELQLYLMYNLVENKDNIFFAGDIHQIINPTYFSCGRLKSLFSLNSRYICEKYLTKNYRSQSYIVELANKLSDIRRKYIAKQNEENEQLVKAINEGQTVFNLQKSEQNLKQMLLAINEKANAATIVVDNEDKRYLESIIGGQSNNIYTVTEIKGLEFEYIFCYNLTGKYSIYWRDIFSGKAKKNAKYRYYFNIFYVSITRARKYLCIYNEEESVLFTNEISELFEFVKEYEIECLCLEDKDNNSTNWESKARELEEAEVYDKAILAYKKANSNSKNIFRCEAKIKAKEKDYESAVKTMLQIGEYKYAKKYAHDSGQGPMIILSAMLSGDADYEQLEKEYGRNSINEVLANSIMNKDYSDLVNFNYIENYILINMMENIDKINNGIKVITGDKE